jgi:hypothetical protein
MTQPDDAVPADAAADPQGLEPDALDNAATDETDDVEADEADDARPAPAPSRTRAWVVIISGGALGTLGALISAAQLLSALDGRSSGAANLALITLIFSIVIGGLVASIGFKALGVRGGWRSALLGAVVAVVGYFAPFILGAVVS